MTEEPTEKPISDEFADLVDDLNPVADLGDTIRQIQSRYLKGLLLTYLAAMGVGMLAVLINPVRDWLLFGGMFLVILAYIILYLKAVQRKRPVIQFISLLSSGLLLIFWAFILFDRIPERMVFVDGQLLVRATIPLLWVPVVLLSIVAVALVVHWAYVGRMVEREWGSA